jgi:chromosome segregation ATPase
LDVALEKGHSSVVEILRHASTSSKATVNSNGGSVNVAASASRTVQSLLVRRSSSMRSSPSSDSLYSSKEVMEVANIVYTAMRNPDSCFVDLVTAFKVVDNHNGALSNQLLECGQIVQHKLRFEEACASKLKAHEERIQDNKAEIEKLRLQLQQLEPRSKEMQRQTTSIESDLKKAQEEVKSAEKVHQRLQKVMEQMDTVTNDARAMLGMASAEEISFSHKVAQVTTM